MKIAVTYENGTVFQHFGHTEQFKVYQVEDGRVTGTEILDTNGSGHGALAGFLRDAGVEALICGGLGMGARNALAQAGVTLYAGVTGDADAAVQALLADRLPTVPRPTAAIMTVAMITRTTETARPTTAADTAAHEKRSGTGICRSRTFFSPRFRPVRG